MSINLSEECIKDMQTIHFVADLHHSHPKIVDICNRPIYLDSSVFSYLKSKHANESNWKWSNDKEWKDLINPLHNDWLLNEVINKHVNKKHTLYLLGDVSMDKRDEAEKFLDRLNGIKFLIEGNHDNNISNSTRFQQIKQIKDFTYSKFGLNLHIVLCHYPINSWNRRVHGSWHLYGHVHGRDKNSGLSFDVGLDNPELLEITGGVYRPLNLYEIYILMNKKQENSQYNFKEE